MSELDLCAIYPEVLEYLEFQMVAESESDDEEDEAGTGFNLKKMIAPLNNWSFNPLGMVSNVAHTKGGNIADYTTKQSAMDRERHVSQIFHIQFDSRELPFDYKLHSSGKLVISSAREGCDPRIDRGVTVFGVNKTPLPISPNVVTLFEEMISQVSCPYNIVFEIFDLSQPGNPYEEEEDEEDEEGVGESTEDDDEGDDEEKHVEDHRNTVRNPQSFLLRTGIKTVTTISDRVRALVVGGGGGG
eukprot:CAMPEP_0182428026 /NCGR_PEP_ID=MMETSP1167-20130531/20961_1 /TAXON_ID=2988 /ORGANISM="Mallomonas Sp, Strain CCMP3275" /LENGTH=243 /DNA_ID=CAMNT_0024610651 /DNA_START=206 /DNA_END=933 /DNA_ORIENTATION=-